MKLYEFVCEKHDDFGTLGWRQKSQPDFDPLSGMAVAHDIMEHFPNGDESPADEFQALGASMVIRGEQYYANKGQRDISPASNAASDMPEILRHVIYEDMHLPEPPKTRPIRNFPEFEDYISEFISESLKLVDSEFEHEKEEEKAKMREVVKKARGWIRIGMRRALKRYKGRLFDALSMFCEIEKQADRLLKEAYEGQVMQVYIKGRTVRCQFEEPEYEDE